MFGGRKNGKTHFGYPLTLQHTWYPLPITRRHILHSSKLKEFADDNFKFDENGIKLSKRVENTVGKGEIARYEQFLLFPQCIQKARFPGASKGVIVWEWVNIHGTLHIRQMQPSSHGTVGNIQNLRTGGCWFNP